MNKKQCNKCKRELPLSEFYGHRRNKDGLRYSCKECDRLRGRRSNKLYALKHRDKMLSKQERYRRSFKGRATRMWHDMKKRVSKHKPYVDRGIEVRCTEEEFMDWILNDPQYKICFDWWKTTTYDKVFTPSIDRVNGHGHYELENIRILPLKVNQCRSKAT